MIEEGAIIKIVKIIKNHHVTMIEGHATMKEEGTGYHQVETNVIKVIIEMIEGIETENETGIVIVVERNEEKEIVIVIIIVVVQEMIVQRIGIAMKNRVITIRTEIEQNRDRDQETKINRVIDR